VSLCRLIDDVGGRLGSTLGQLAAFMEESQLKVCDTVLVNRPGTDDSNRTVSYQTGSE
jgi:hypothetical protein